VSGGQADGCIGQSFYRTGDAADGDKCSDQYHDHDQQSYHHRNYLHSTAHILDLYGSGCPSLGRRRPHPLYRLDHQITISRNLRQLKVFDLLPPSIFCSPGHDTNHTADALRAALNPVETEPQWVIARQGVSALH
jgi:hypothetical protein